ncbi:MAG TPA: PcfJ domain-containing protein, partial [Candidatus Bathyarchaeia archaeon]|nr:PcfJ domain-containing protein [Candidatus Bathyarchaeia archaeon]
MQWSKARKQVEDMFAESVKGRVRLHATCYHEHHDEEGRYWITVDGREIVSMPHWIWAWYGWGDGQAPPQDRTKEFAEYMAMAAKGGLGRSMGRYHALSIDEILASEDVFVRALGMLDRRLGKRRLRALDLKEAHPLVRAFHRLRCEAEGIRVDGPTAVIETGHLREPVWPHDPGRAEARRIKREKAARADARLDAAKRTRKLGPLLTKIHRGELAAGQLDNAVAREIHAGFEAAADRDSLLAMLRAIDARSKLLGSAPHARGVVELAKSAADWIRPLDGWRPKTHNADRQFSSLARHLLAAYDVPLFMDKAWTHGTAREQGWFKHLGAGRNIRTAEGLPVPLTKKMAHGFLQAPETYSIGAAFRWGQTLALGGDRRLADALRETRLAREFRDDEFWVSVIRFFIRNPMLDPAQVHPIVDYLWNERFEPRVIFVDRGVAREVGPAQPNLSMRGRTVAALLREVDEWHRRLGREVAGGRLQWKKSAVRDFRFVEGQESSRNMKIWRIRELLSSQELIAEGRRMHHCVSSYAASCHAGRCSIWSVDVETEDGAEALLTIEVGHDA